MVRASAAEQQALLQVQTLDTNIARLAHERRTLPVLTTLADLETHLTTLDTERVRLTAQLSDQQREVARVEKDVEVVRARSARREERLAGATAKDSQALGAEIEHLAARASALEDEQLEVMERVEATEEALAQTTTGIASVAERIQTATAERDAEFARLDAATAELAAQRRAITDGLPAGLLALYEQVRVTTGGLGALALHGQRTEPLAIPLPLAELAAIQAADPEQVVVSEEYGYILVRLS